MKTLQFLSIVAPLCALSNLGVAHAATTDVTTSVFSPLSISSSKAAASLSRFAALQNFSINGAALNNALQPFDRPLLLPSVAQMQSAATTSKLPLMSGTLSLEQMHTRGGAYLVRLQAPDEWIVLAAVGSSQSVVQGANSVETVQNATLNKRLSGEVLMSGTKDASSRVLVNEPVVQAHVTVIGEPLHIKIPIQNRGAIPLQIQTLSASCSCTSDDNSPRVVAAGGSGELSFKVESREEGTRQVSVVVGTNDPLWPRLVLAFQVQTPRAVAPPTLFLSGNKGQAIHNEIDLALPEGATVASVSSNQPFVQAKLVEGGENGAQRIAVDVAAEAPAGQFSGALHVELRNSAITRIVVPVDGYLNNDISVSPRMIALGDVPAGSVLRKSVLLQAPDDQPFSIEAIDTRSAFVKAKAGLGIRATSHVVEVEVEARGASGAALQDRVTLRLSGDRELDIDISGAISLAKTSSIVASSIVVGHLAPDFSVRDANGQMQSLGARRGKKNVLLTFFPKCFTGGCTEHLSSLRDEYANFIHNDTDIIAVSVDAAESAQGQRAFAAKYGFPFPLVPDTNRGLSRLYGAVQTPNDMDSRLSILIDKNGVIRWIDRDVQVSTHGADVLRQMRILGLT